jgi:hypothetical protein
MRALEGVKTPNIEAHNPRKEMKKLLSMSLQDSNHGDRSHMVSPQHRVGGVHSPFSFSKGSRKSAALQEQVEKLK